MPAPRVLITGAGGFTGQHLIAALQARGMTTIALNHHASGSGIDAEEIVCDICQPQALVQALAEARPDYVIHLAAISFVAHQQLDAFYQVNLLGTAYLLDALAALPYTPKKIVIASSANVYGNPGIEPIDEDCCPSPINHYAISKLAMEHLVMSWFKRLPLIITRPFNYTGPGQDPRFLIPKLVAHYQRRSPVIELGNTDIRRDFLDIRNVVALYADLLASPVHSEIINLCSGVAVSLDEILAMLNAIAGYTIEVQVNPEFVRDNEIRILCGNPQKWQQLLGKRPLYSMRETLQWMYQTGLSAAP